MTRQKSFYDQLDEDAAAIDELDDFDSDSFWSPNRKADSFGYIDRWWGRYGFGERPAVDEDLITAHGMVSTFLNAFARDGFYDVRFTKDISTAGTDMRRKAVILTPAPLLDKELNAQQAGRILTGLAGHEVSHPRFGKDTHWAVRRAFPNSKTAHVLGNLLDDVRIERRFIETYPGYSDIFEPTLDYIARAAMKKNGGRKLNQYIDRQTNLAIAAIRYPQASNWKGLEQERDWWQAWAKRWGPEDAPRRVVEAIRIALRHIAMIKAAVEIMRQQQRQQGSLPQPGGGDDTPEDDQQQGSSPPGEDQEARVSEDEDADGRYGSEDADEDDEDGGLDAPSDGQGGDDPDDVKIDAEGAGSSGDASHDAGEGDDEDEAQTDGGDVTSPLTDEELEKRISEMEDGDLGEAADEGEGSTQLPTCAGKEAVESAAKDNGVDRDDIKTMEDKADETIENAKLYEDDGHGRKVVVARSTKQLVRTRLRNRRSTWFQKSDLAARYIRDALVRSRTGHEETAHYQKRGRLDQHALHRVGLGDYRLFDRKSAPSPGRYNIWFMLDRSGSMDGGPDRQTAQMTTAVADALKHVPTVRAAAWAWSDTWMPNTYGPGVALLWRTGMDTAEIAKFMDLTSGGTPDSAVMGWAARAIKAETRSNETPVIIFASDGWGSDSMSDRVREARSMGILVASMALGGGIDRHTQEARFGRDGYIQWEGSIIATSKPLARMIAKLVGRDRRTR